MKSNNGLQIIIRITVCVTMLSSLIGAFMLHSTPSQQRVGQCAYPSVCGGGCIVGA